MGGNAAGGGEGREATPVPPATPATPGDVRGRQETSGDAGTCRK